MSFVDTKPIHNAIHKLLLEAKTQRPWGKVLYDSVISELTKVVGEEEPLPTDSSFYNASYIMFALYNVITHGHDPASRMSSYPLLLHVFDYSTPKSIPVTFNDNTTKEYKLISFVKPETSIFSPPT